MRRKGDVEPFDLGQVNEVLKGVTVYLQHIGPSKAQEVALKLSTIQWEEDLRLLEIRKGLKPEDAPGLFGRRGPLAFLTPEGKHAALALARECTKDFAVRVEGHPPLEGERDVKVISAELNRLGACMGILHAGLEVQALTPLQFPASAGAGDDSTGGRSEEAPKSNDSAGIGVPHPDVVPVPNPVGPKTRRKQR